jgi:P4 family phage/plasmid primase-like protien
LVIPPTSEIAIAEDFADRYGDILRYVKHFGGWMVYDGTVWRRDERMQVHSFARDVCKEYAAGKKGNEGNAIASRSMVFNVETLARSELAETADVWDTDPLLLNTPAGPVMLTTGTLYSHNAERHLTKITAKGPGGDCPLWLKFLARVTGYDADLQAYLQRLCGYCLTGLTREQIIAFFWGPGGNGKSVFLNTIANIMGDYAKVAPSEMLTASSIDRHPTELAGLRGSRLATAIETEEGRQWAESKIKSLSGGDKLTAHFMRQDYFDYRPEFKLLIAGNHKPGLRNVDEAIRRRFHMIPFTASIPAEERDKDLEKKLEAEWGGILAWMIAGAKDWWHSGLNPPACVLEATSAYLEAEDAMANWITERCNTGQSYSGKSSSLFQDYREWCQRTGEPAPSQKRFTQNMEVRGYGRERKSTGQHFLGITLRPNMGVDD